MPDPQIFTHAATTAWTDIAPGNRRRVLVHTPELMLVEAALQSGITAPTHSHPHVQTTYVASGKFDVTIDGRTETVVAGDSFIVPSGLVHGVHCVEAGSLIDTFTPRRDDFL